MLKKTAVCWYLVLKALVWVCGKSSHHIVLLIQQNNPPSSARGEDDSGSIQELVLSFEMLLTGSSQWKLVSCSRLTAGWPMDNRFLVASSGVNVLWECLWWCSEFVMVFVPYVTGTNGTEAWSCVSHHSQYCGVGFRCLWWCNWTWVVEVLYFVR